MSINISIDLFPDNVVIYRYKDEDFIFIDINKHAQKCENVVKNNLLGKKLTEVFPGVKEFGLFHLLLKVHQNGGEEELDMTFYEDERISGWRQNRISRLDNGDIIVFYKDLSEYKIAEEKYLRESKYLNIIQKATHMGNWHWDMQSNEIIWSDEVFRIFREKEQSFSPSYERFLSYLSKEDQVDLEAAIRISVKNKTTYRYTHKIFCADQTISYVEESGEAQYNSEGKAISMIGSILDITQKKKKEHEDFRHKELLNVSDTIVFYWKAEENWPVEYVSNNIKQFGYSPEEFLSAAIRYTDIIFEDDKEKVFEEVASYTASNINSFTQIYRILTSDGKIRWIDDRTVIERDKHGKVVNYLGTIIDITEHKQAEEHLKFLGHIIDKSTNEVFIFEADSLKFTYCNQEAQKHLGYTLNEMKKMLPFDIKPQYSGEVFRSLLQPLLQGSTNNLMFETIHKCKNGEEYDVEIHLELMDIDDKKHFVVIANDITDIKKTKEQVTLLNQAVEQTDEMVRITDKDAVITYVNEAFVAHTGYRLHELIGQPSSILKSGKHDDSFYKKIWDTVLAGNTYRGTLINKKKDNNIYHEEQTITPIFDINKEIKNFVVTSQDVTQRIKTEEELKRLATIDHLTSIYNRYQINKEIDSELDRSLRYKEVFSLIMFDIDHFKLVNDNYGHDAGDYVLRELSKLVLQYIRASDKFGRWGGEEFMLLIPKSTKEEALLTANKIRKVIEQYIFKDISKITVSLGVSVCNVADSKENILKRVDDALYLAKENGRNRVEFK